MLTKKRVQTAVLLIIGIVVMVNFISNRFFFRLDFTEDQRYSLSKATLDILDELPSPVTVKAYFSEDLPPDVAKVRTDFKDLLVEYNNYSDGDLVYEFINPNKDQKLEMEAQQNGISPIMINVRERDQVKQQRAYLGAVIQMNGKTEVIPFIQPGAAMEFALSSAIKKLSISKKTKVALLKGNGEATLSSLQQLNKQLSILYDVSELELSDTTDISGDIKTIIVIAPKDSVAKTVFEKLDKFIDNGGRLLVALNRIEADLQRGSSKSINTGFENWLKEKGIEIEDKLIVDAKCGNIMVQQRQGIFVMNTPISFPYLPIISNFAKHSITTGLEAVLMPFASPVSISPKDTTIKYTPLAFTSVKSGVQSSPVFFNVQKRWNESDFDMKSLPVAVAVEGRINGKENSKMVVFGDADFVINGEGERAQKQEDDNISLVANAIDWLSDDTGLAELRTKGVTYRMLDADIDDTTKSLIKYFNFLLPIILIIGYGIFRFQVKRKIRNNLRTVDYV